MSLFLWGALLSNIFAAVFSPLQVHPPRQEDGVCGRARLHHGDVPGRQSYRVRRHSLQDDCRQHVSPVPAKRAALFPSRCSKPFDSSPSRPQGLLAGMNRFLSLLEITFRRDPNNFRPRINKLNSIKVRRTVNASPAVRLTMYRWR